MNIGVMNINMKPANIEVNTKASLELRTFPSSAAFSSFRWEGSSVFPDRLDFPQP